MGVCLTGRAYALHLFCSPMKKHLYKQSRACNIQFMHSAMDALTHTRSTPCRPSP